MLQSVMLNILRYVIMRSDCMSIDFVIKNIHRNNLPTGSQRNKFKLLNCCFNVQNQGTVTYDT